MIKQHGFTIVELLIVIVVIAILAAISIVAYNGSQERSINSRRLSDVRTIEKALELYKTQIGSYPTAQSNTTGGWERSSINPGNFIQALKTQKIIDTVPVDPVNSAPNGSTGAENTFTGYAYYSYPAGYYGCTVPMYVLKIEAPGKSMLKESPGLNCTPVSNPTYGSGGTGILYFKGYGF